MWTNLSTLCGKSACSLQGWGAFLRTLVVKKSSNSREQREQLLLRRFLQAEFLHRCRKNAKYSLRAFARFLEVDPSLLSKIFRQERAISEKLFKQFAEKLKLSPEQISELSKYPTSESQPSEC